MKQLKDTQYRDTKKYIRWLLDDDKGMDDVERQLLIDTYNELTIDNAEHKQKYVDWLMKSYFERLEEKKKQEYKTFSDEWFSGFVLMYLFVIFMLFVGWELPNTSNITLYYKMACVGITTIIFLILALVPKWAQYC